MLILNFLLILLFNLYSVENKFTARGIFVSIEYRGVDVKGSVTYSLRFLNFLDLIYSYQLPFYLIKDISDMDLTKSFRVKVYGQSFYVFRYIESNKSKENIKLGSSSKNNSNNTEPDFFDYYFKNFNKNFSFYAFDIIMRGLVDDYTRLSLKQRREVSKDLFFFIKNINPLSFDRVE